jgi:hypothetical protein
MLEGEGDAFRYPLKCETLRANRMKEMFKSENQELLAHRSRLRQTNA